MKLRLGKLASPLGEMLLMTDASERVRALDFGDRPARLQRTLHELYGTFELIEAPAPPPIAAALSRYFDGDLTALEVIPVAACGSDLQRQVWRALREIPAGRTTSYGELARTLGFQDPRAAIDIGAANGANPVALIVPCHRVIASSGDLKGYAWGQHRKRWLLEHEGAIVKSTGSMEAARLPGF